MMREMFRSIERHSSSAPMDAKHQTDEFDRTSCPAEQERPYNRSPMARRIRRSAGAAGCARAAASEPAVSAPPGRCPGLEVRFLAATQSSRECCARWLYCPPEHGGHVRSRKEHT